MIATPLPECDLDQTLALLKDEIYRLHPKQQHLLCEWINIWSKYLSFESSFDPTKLLKYNRGDILLIQMGYNVGNEQGGKRYAVVIEDNPMASPIVSVVPIATLGDGKNTIHFSEIMLGEIIPGAHSYALPLQIRTISKLRIIQPKRSPKKHRLTPDQMDLIDEEIRKNFTKNR